MYKFKLVLTYCPGLLKTADYIPQDKWGEFPLKHTILIKGSYRPGKLTSTEVCRLVGGNDNSLMQGPT